MACIIISHAYGGVGGMWHALSLATGLGGPEARDALDHCEPPARTQPGRVVCRGVVLLERQGNVPVDVVLCRPMRPRPVNECKYMFNLQLELMLEILVFIVEK